MQNKEDLSEESEDAEDNGGFSDGEGGGDDNLPGSSDFSSTSPADDAPRGPPPPDPVNGPPDRSRSPRRHSAETDASEAEIPFKVTLCLHRQLPGPHFDLTTIRLPFPHDLEELWPLFRPWSGDWMQWNWDGVCLTEAAEAVLQGAVPWQDLLQRSGRGEPELHIYTDGSAQETTGRSGYSVVILLRLGAVAAVFGLLGGQLLGNAASPWPFGGPAALTSEQVAVAAALLWVVQAKTMLPAVDCCVHVDCLAAGRAATGEWAPVDALSVHADAQSGTSHARDPGATPADRACQGTCG